MPLPEGGNQAAGLIGEADRRPVQVIAVASGKGGVGKTNVSVNLATVQALRGRKVWMLDADLGLANIDVLLGLNVRRNLSHVLDGSCDLADIIIEGPGGMKIVPASSGVARMTNLGPAECGGLIQAFSEVADDVDLLVVDTAAGISTSVTMFARAAHHALVVVCDEPASITDAYALIKVLVRDHGMHQIQVLCNMVRSPGEGKALYNKIARVTDRYLEVSLNYAGYVPYDDFLRKALQRQQPVVTVYPEARSSTAFKKLADTADTWSVPTGPSGHLEFFFERALGGSGTVAEARA
ncbi:MAG: MinD/ParA family protein [Wenzhouxiangella sp.]|jgi:flagellar biosynthesis protein FlhG|nr:MinD/ParA family protein [Wenzhouxiangella sp.]